jgi:glyoxylase-like metal-dependent hydrolase (beta-lactamase superfamily II)
MSVYTVDAFQVGAWVDPEPRILYLGEVDKNVDIASYFWLVRRDGFILMVDTGYDLDTGRKVNPELRQERGQDTLSHLQRAGIRPEDVSAVVLTHLHWDHCSPTLAAFRNAQIYVQKRELDAVLRPSHPWFRRFTYPEIVRKLEADWSDRVTVLEGDKEIREGLRCVRVGGHTPGLQSLLVATDAGMVAVASDVSILARNVEEDIPVGFNCNLEECFLGMERLRTEADHVLPSHDPAVPAMIRALGIGKE